MVIGKSFSRTVLGKLKLLNKKPCCR